jgi:phage terminase small subunit
VELSAKRKRFCDEYLIDCNATQAAIRAGYKAKYANTNAQKILQNTTVRNYIDARMKELEDAKIADAKEIMEYLTSVIRGQSEAEIVVVEGEGDGCSSARRITKAPDEKEKLKAAELLGKRYGIFTDKINLEGATRVVIVDDIEE